MPIWKITIHAIIAIFLLDEKGGSDHRIEFPVEFLFLQVLYQVLS